MTAWQRIMGIIHLLWDMNDSHRSHALSTEKTGLRYHIAGNNNPMNDPTTDYLVSCPRCNAINFVHQCHLHDLFGLLRPVQSIISSITNILLLTPDVRASGSLLKVGRDIRRPNRFLVNILVIIPMTSLLIGPPCLSTFPVCAHLLDLLLIVELSIIVLADTT